MAIQHVRRLRAQGHHGAQRVMIVDLVSPHDGASQPLQALLPHGLYSHLASIQDAHQGNGHERDALGDNDVFIVDCYNPHIYPGMLCFRLQLGREHNNKEVCRRYACSKRYFTTFSAPKYYARGAISG